LKIPHGEFLPMGNSPWGTFTKINGASWVFTLFSCGKEINKCFIYI
jgi:hypothetical protein